ncbi:hypothetical protein J3A83DRAFT_4369645 [Scleroderma citrinum]
MTSQDPPAESLRISEHLSNVSGLPYFSEVHTIGKPRIGMVKTHPCQVISPRRIPSRRASLHRGDSVKNKLVLSSERNELDIPHGVTGEYSPTLEYTNLQLTSKNSQRWQTRRFRRDFDGAWWTKNAWWTQGCDECPDGPSDHTLSLTPPKCRDLEGAWWSKNAWWNQGCDMCSNTSKSLSDHSSSPRRSQMSSVSFAWTDELPAKFTPIFAVGACHDLYSGKVDLLCYHEAADGVSTSEEKIARRTRPDLNSAGNVPTHYLRRTSEPLVLHSPRPIRYTKAAFDFYASETDSLMSGTHGGEQGSVDVSTMSSEHCSLVVPPRHSRASPVARADARGPLASQINNRDKSFARKLIRNIQLGRGERAKRYPGTDECTTFPGLLGNPSSTASSCMSGRDATSLDDHLADLPSLPYNTLPHSPVRRMRLGRVKGFVKRVLKFPCVNIHLSKRKPDLACMDSIRTYPSKASPGSWSSDK